MAAYATAEQLADYLRTGQGQLPPDAGRVLGDVGELIDSRAPNASEAAKRSVSLAVAARVLSNPQGIVQRQIGPHYTERYDQQTARSPMALWPADLSILGVEPAVEAADAAGFTGSLPMRPPAVRAQRTLDVWRGWPSW